MPVSESLTCSQKHYLLIIYQLCLAHVPVTITEIAHEANVSKSSATGMTTKLCERGYLCKEFYGEIKLKEKGESVAKSLYSQVKILHDFFADKLGLNHEQAQKDAVAIAVYSSAMTTAMLTDFLEKRKSDSAIF